ncbi:CDP-diacylglycerol--glycerol-3-phosphate 3-phosphatidyltransferase [Gymnodinialimonas sp. 2305UL16-5]|uniref:CDP-diacylglycerol--glycerol-3-phosphate 3-phosphatidyltransferase n=1 Tax=Gymnodinialimonas mytili TaxID=3126503 RepID=UPI0030B6CC4A
MQWTVPNILTLIRLVAAPMVALVFLLLPRPFSDWIALILFLSASLTDYLDGVLARRWGQETKFGAMMDPIADKAMVVIALAVVLGLYGTVAFGGTILFNAMVLVPVVVILFREVFVSGLREFLGEVAGTLKVTRLAKWKTFVQMVAIGLMFSFGLFDHYFGRWTEGMDGTLIQGILDGAVPDEFGLSWLYMGLIGSSFGALALLWIAAVLTLVTGADYFLKARPHLRDGG